MDLERIRSACDETESHVRTIAAYRRARTPIKPVFRPSADAPDRPRLWYLIAGAVIGAALSVLIVLLSLQPWHHPVPPVPDVEPANATRAAAATPRAELVSMATVLNGMKRAHTITVAAFSLRHDAQVVRILESAARRKAHVSVILARGFGISTKQNTQTARELTAHGVRVKLVRVAQNFTRVNATVVDGQVYLSDRDWTSRSGAALVVHDLLPNDRVLNEKSFAGRIAANDHLWTRKADALTAEATMLATRHSKRVRVSTESFGAGTAVYRRLVERKKAGDDVLLLVARSQYQRSSAEKAAVSGLRHIGVKIRLSASNEKLAVDGDSVWMGSADATADVPNQLDFGIVVTNHGIADRLNKQFEREWAAAVTP